MANEKKLEDYLHLYLGCDVQFVFETRSEYPHLKHDLRIGKMGGVKKNGYAKRVEIIMGNGTFHDVAFEEIKLLLRPLSDMKEEEVSHCWATLDWSENITTPSKRRELLNEEFLDTDEGRECGWFSFCKILPYLLKQGFDIFGLIDAGLAVDKTTLTLK